MIEYFLYVALSKFKCKPKVFKASKCDARVELSMSPANSLAIEGIQDVMRSAVGFVDRDG